MAATHELDREIGETRAQTRAGVQHGLVVGELPRAEIACMTLVCGAAVP